MHQSMGWGSPAILAAGIPLSNNKQRNEKRQEPPFRNRLRMRSCERVGVRIKRVVAKKE
jgi:hypothetical protein